MPNEPETAVPSAVEVRNRLHAAATALRDSQSLDPQVHHVLAELLDELGKALESPEAPPEEVRRLAADTAHLTALLHRERGPELANARDRLEGLLVQAESRAPVAVDLVRRLIDALANWGI